MHIARNTEKIVVKKVAMMIQRLTTTFSNLVATDLMEKIGK
jgi:hypothetical protein